MQNMEGRRILVVDDEEDTVEACTQVLSKNRCIVDAARDALEALELVKAKQYELVIADIKMPKMDGIELLKALKEIDNQMAVVMITGYATIETAIQSMKAGAYDYIPKPFTPDQLRAVAAKALEKVDLIKENSALRERLSRKEESLEIVGRSEAMGELNRLIERLAPTSSTVIIYGETGTGKELVAREIHRKSSRSKGDMVTVNCAAIPSELLESELFGHEKGAFTGAIKRKRGCFEMAQNGTLFLDEIGDMSPDLQVKVLRAIQQKEIKPVGGEKRIFVDVRIIAATHKDLKEEIKKGSFREDLYYRLNVVPLHLPPLRARKDDIPLLAEYFLAKYSGDLKKRLRGISHDAIELLTCHGWPGNIRELENAIERAVILADGPELDVGDFKQIMLSMEEGQGRARKKADALRPLEEVEREYIMEVLRATEWNRKKAAEILGISSVTLWRKMEKEK